MTPITLNGSNYSLTIAFHRGVFVHITRLFFIVLGMSGLGVMALAHFQYYLPQQALFAGFADVVIVSALFGISFIQLKCEKIIPPAPLMEEVQNILIGLPPEKPPTPPYLSPLEAAKLFAGNRGWRSLIPLASNEGGWSRMSTSRHQLSFKWFLEKSF